MSNDQNNGAEDPPKAMSVLKELGVIESGQLQHREGARVTALQLLQALLAKSKVSSEDIRQAFQELTEAASKNNNNDRNQSTSSSGGDQDALPASEKKGQTQDLKEKATVIENSSVRRRHVALHVYYDGEKYSGLAENVGREDDCSVERALFAALQKTHLCLPPPENAKTETVRTHAQYSRCGRTDRGVSAAGQVVALRLKSAIALNASWDPEGLELVSDDQLPKNSLDNVQVYCPPRNNKKSAKKKKGPTDPAGPQQQQQQQSARAQRTLHELPYDKMLNNVLPPDIRVLGWTPVSDEFSARFSATTRTYRYFFNNERGLLKLPWMQDALTRLEGEHDFRNFCKMDVEHVYNFVRRIHSARLYRLTADGAAAAYQAPKEEGGDDDHMGDGMCYFEIHGQAFLWHQIRCIVSLLFLVGRGLEAPSLVSDLLDIRKYPGKPAYALADERPLVLHHCGYPNLKMGFAVTNLWNVTCHWMQQLDDLLVAAARVRNGLNLLQDHAAVSVQDVQQFCQARLLEREKKGSQYREGSKIGTFGGTVDLERINNQAPVGVNLTTMKTISWKHALQWLKNLGLLPDPVLAKETKHMPFSQRPLGTTYEEKIASLQQSSKRKCRYEENVIKKRKSKEEDQAFYAHMAKQGGTAL